ncbi:MAG: hypothetical protein IJ496_01700 [Ruminococcus sp.]|nr:hypothetical protein [Ruminococcus sp.]
MEKHAKKKHAFKRVLIGAAALLLLYILITLTGISGYLIKYGYGIKELPRTIAVYCNFSDGFTVDETESGRSVFIGRPDYIYDTLAEDSGYYESDRMGLVRYYNKSGEEAEPADFYIHASDDWCHWFRVYEMSDGYRIEDFQ